MKHCFFSFLLICLSTILVNAQQTEIDANSLVTYNDALKLYNNKSYAAAQKTFSEFSINNQASSYLEADVAYYDAMCSVYLNQKKAEKKVLDFTNQYPNSPKKNWAYLNTGNHYYKTGKATRALKWFQKINVYTLSESDKKDITFKTAYCLLVSQDLESAKKEFSSLLNDSKYGSDSKYYYGYISYKQEEYEVAEKNLSELANHPTYRSKVAYYLLDINFKTGKFEKCVEIGKELLKTSRFREKSEISKIIGESYFNLKKYKEAIPYLKAYKGKKGKWDNTDYYQLGFAYFKQNDYENAVRNFNRILGEKSAISQNAYYNLGECYLSLNKKSEALNAFKSASEMSFAPRVQEDAFLNYAKLSYEEGNPYKSVADVLQDFLKTYPKSTHYEEINGLVISSYLHQKDYTGALDYLSKNNSKQNAALAKEISYYKGIQLFAENQLQKSLPYFTEGTKSTDINIRAKANYWLAETNYRLDNYDEALKQFTSFKKIGKETDEYNHIFYNIGYTHFKLKNYQQAVNAFQEFLKAKIEDQNLLNDATIRLGDSYYAVRDYKNAIKTYKKVVDVKAPDADYAQFQMGMSYGFINKDDLKIKALMDLINMFALSTYKDDALFQIGNTYAAQRNNEKAHEAYQRLIDKHGKSLYIPQALLRKGLLYYNEGQNEKAIQNFKTVAAKYPNSSEAEQAVRSAKNVYIDMGNVDAYASWVKTLSFVNITDSELDKTMYNAAENKFLENNTAKAIDGFEKYLKRFPTGLYSLKTHFYLAQLYVKIKQPEKAISHYQYVISQEQSEFSEESLNKLSQILLTKENWEKAIPLLERLELEANSSQNKLYAQSNLMKGYYQSKNYSKAVTYAEKVLRTDKLEKRIENDAKLILARSAFQTQNWTTAEQYFTEVEKNASGELKAEALYYNAFFKNKSKKHEESNKVIQQITADYSAYKYWGAKSFIIMAKNYYALENSDPYQATYILENIIKNFSQFEDVVKDAQKELQKIKANEAKTNTSVTPKN